MLESALCRARKKWACSDEDLASLAAAYAFGLARNHPLVDGKKRAAFLADMVFLGLNGIDFEPVEAEAAVIIRDLAAGHVGEEGLTRWVRDRWQAEPKPSRPQRLSRKRSKAEKDHPPGRRRLPSRTKKK